MPSPRAPRARARASPSHRRRNGSGASAQTGASSVFTEPPSGRVDEGDALGDEAPGAGRPRGLEQVVPALGAGAVGGSVVDLARVEVVLRQRGSAGRRRPRVAPRRPRPPAPRRRARRRRPRRRRRARVSGAFAARRGHPRDLVPGRDAAGATSGRPIAPLAPATKTFNGARGAAAPAARGGGHAVPRSPATRAAAPRAPAAPCRSRRGRVLRASPMSNRWLSAWNRVPERADREHRSPPGGPADREQQGDPEGEHERADVADVVGVLDAVGADPARRTTPAPAACRGPRACGRHRARRPSVRRVGSVRIGAPGRSARFHALTLLRHHWRSVEPLRDAHGRPITDLRVSVTDRCNFRCRYCMPAEGMPWLDRSEILSFEEIERLVARARAARRQRGPADRRRAAGPARASRRWSRCCAAIDGIDDLSVTTNGYLLERDARALVEAGIDRVNVSVDSLARDRFHEITRRDALPQVLRGLDAIAAFERVRPIKVNAVAMRDFTEDEVFRFCELARSTRLPGALHRVHAARRRPRLERRPGADRGRAAGADRGPPPAGRAAARAARDRARLPRSPTAAARSASSTRSPSPSAATATGSGSPPTASCGPASSRSARPTCASRCAPAPPTQSSSGSSATRSGARSSSTASTIRASWRRRGR